MQGRPLDERELLDSESVAGHLVEPGSVFALLRDHRRVLFPESMFADLFPSGRGRPSIPVDIAASILVLQALFGLSDRDAMRAVRTDLQWKVACGLPIGHGGFDASGPDVLAPPAAGLGCAEPDLRRGPGGDRANRCGEGQDPPGAGLHGAR
jgi:hypothetical protein